MVWASADIHSNIYVDAICKAKREDKVVALTFDDGPERTMTQKVLEILDKYKVKATFFVVASKIEGNEAILKRMVREGHIVANHTYSHSAYLPMKSYKDISEELILCQNKIYGTIGKKTILFRPPFGVTNPNIAKAVRRLNLKCIGWSVRSFDTISLFKREYICKRIIKKIHKGAVILLHDKCNDSDKLLEMLIISLYNMGYKIVPLDELLKIDAYEVV